MDPDDHWPPKVVPPPPAPVRYSTEIDEPYRQLHVVVYGYSTDIAKGGLSVIFDGIATATVVNRCGALAIQNRVTGRRVTINAARWSSFISEPVEDDDETVPSFVRAVKEAG